MSALSHLKLLQTKQEDGVDLKTPIPQPEPSTFIEHGKNLLLLKMTELILFGTLFI